MFNKDILLIDEENSGLDPNTHEIIQLAGVLLDRKTLKEKKHFNSYIKPKNWEGRSAEAMAVNNISFDQVRKAPALRTVLKSFNETFGRDVILSYYVGVNDINFLYAAYKQCNMPFPFDYHFFNIWAVFYAYMAKKNLLTSKADYAGFGLESMIEHFKIILPPTLHDALVDCRVEAALLRKVMEELHV